MSYNTKYDVTFKDLHRSDLAVRIKQTGYSGGSSNYVGYGRSHVKVQFEDVDFWQPVKPSNAEIKILTEAAGQYDEFRLADDRDYLIEIVRPGSTSTTEYQGSFTINALSTVTKQDSYADIGACLNSESDYALYYRYRLYIDEDGDGFTSGDIKAEKIIQDNEVYYDWTPAMMVNELITLLIDSDSNYSAEDDDGDDLLDVIYRDGTQTFTENVRITVEAYQYHTETYGSPTNYDCNSFGGGQSGDILTLRVTEDGGVTYITLATYEMLESTEVADVVASCVDQINTSGQDYRGYIDPNDATVIVVEYTGSGAGNYTLDVQTGTAWDVTASGLASSTTTDDDVIWTGYNIAGTFKERYISKYYEISIMATDGLADLKFEKYDYATGSIMWMKVIAECLQATGLNLNINSAFDVFEDGHNTTSSDDPLRQAYFNVETIGKKKLYDILNEKLYGFCLMQDGGEWWITRLESEASYDYRTFDSDGNYISNGNHDPVVNVGSHAQHQNLGYGVGLERSGYMALDSAYRKFIIKQSYGLKDQLLRDPTMVLFGADGELIYWESDAPSSSIYTQTDDKLLRINAIYETTDSPGNYLQQVVHIQGTTLRIKYEFKTGEIEASSLDHERYDDYTIAYSQDADSGDYYFNLADVHSDTSELYEGLYLLISGETVYIDRIEDGRVYLDHDPGIAGAPISWYPIFCEAQIQLDNARWWDGTHMVDSAVRTFELFRVYWDIDWEANKEFTKRVDFTMSQARDVTVRIYQPVNVDIKVSKITLDVPGKYEKGRRVEKYYSELVNYYKGEEKELEFYLGDLPNYYSNASDLYINALFLDEELSTLTDLWSGDQYVETVGERIVKQMGKNGIILPGTFAFKDIISFRHILYDNNLTKYFCRKAGEWDLTYNTVDGEWIEIAKGSPGTLITEEKIYEDTPRGAALYSENRDSFESAGGGGITVIQGLQEAEVLEIIRGTTGSFTGSDLNSERSIILAHGLGHKLVNVQVWKGTEEIMPANLKKNNQGSKTQMKLTVNVPYNDNTNFEYRIN